MDTYRLMDDDGEDRKCSSSDADEMKIHLIMTDYSMPGMTGYELLKKIKESADLRDPRGDHVFGKSPPSRKQVSRGGCRRVLVEVGSILRRETFGLRDFVMRSGETCCDPTTSAMKRRRGEDSCCSVLPSEHQPSKSTSRVGVAVISPKRMKVRSRD